MQQIDDVSYGVIPLIKDGEVWKVFLIHQLGRAGDVYWTFPKGHGEEGESPVESALRELQEETGIVLQKLHASSTYDQKYSFPSNDTMVNKKVHYYLGLAVDKGFKIQEEEVKEAGWLTFVEGKERLTHQRAKDMLEIVEKDLREQNIFEIN